MQYVASPNCVQELCFAVEAGKSIVTVLIDKSFPTALKVQDMSGMASTADAAESALQHQHKQHLTRELRLDAPSDSVPEHVFKKQVQRIESAVENLLRRKARLY